MGKAGENGIARQHLAYNADLPYLTATPIRWSGGFVRVYEAEGSATVMGYSIGGLQPYDKKHDCPIVECGCPEAIAADKELVPLKASILPLPVNFVTHELLKVDAYDEAELFEFVNTWGLPVSPFRSKPGYSSEGIRKTNDMLGGILGSSLHLVSLTEARESIELLQTSVHGFIAMLRHPHPEWHDYDVINWGKSHPLTISYRSVEMLDLRPSPWANLTAEICNQVIDMLHDDGAEWAECPHCKMPFKRHRPESLSVKQQKRLHGGLPSISQSTSAFCSDKCRVNHFRRKTQNDIANTPRKSTSGNVSD